MTPSSGQSRQEGSGGLVLLHPNLPKGHPQRGKPGAQLGVPADHWDRFPSTGPRSLWKEWSPWVVKQVGERLGTGSVTLRCQRPSALRPRARQLQMSPLKGHTAQRSQENTRGFASSHEQTIAYMCGVIYMCIYT